MPTLTIESRDDAERLAIKQALAYLAQLRQVADTAPDGAVLAACEQVALTDGRRVLRSTLAAALQGRVARVEQKGGARLPGRVRPRRPTQRTAGPHRPHRRRAHRPEAHLFRLRRL